MFKKMSLPPGFLQEIHHSKPKSHRDPRQTIENGTRKGGQKGNNRNLLSAAPAKKLVESIVSRCPGKKVERSIETVALQTCSILKGKRRRNTGNRGRDRILKGAGGEKGPKLDSLTENY